MTSFRPPDTSASVGTSELRNERRGDSPTPTPRGPKAHYGARSSRVLVLVGGVVLLALSIAFGVVDGRRNAQRELDHRMQSTAHAVRADIQSYFERARAINLQLAHNPGFANFYADPRSRSAKIAGQTIAVREANDALAYVEQLYPGKIAEACFIDRGGAENARVVNGVAARPDELSPDERSQPFFAPSFALEPGQVYQAKPYVSPDTRELVISNSTMVPRAAGRPAIVHFEVTIESFRREIADDGMWMRIADSATGEIVADSRRSLAGAAPANVAADTSLVPIVSRHRDGAFTAGDLRMEVARVATQPTNANRWVVVATAPRAGVDLSGLLFGWPAAMLLGALAMLTLAGLSFRTYQRELRRQALTDELTGLPNRTLFRDRIDRAIGLAKRQNTRAAVIIVDVNRFKDVNDAIGHQRGDLFLKELAGRLGTAVRSSDTVSRLSGDEFGILLPHIDGPEDIQRVVGRIQQGVEAVFTLDGAAVQIDLSQGAAIFPDHGSGVDELVQRAGIAMDDAKSEHRGYALYDAAQDSFSVRRLEMVPELRRAIENGELTLCYQPRVIVSDGTVEGVEALARWHHSRLGHVSPTEFIALAEDTGLIRGLTLGVLEQAVGQAAAWRRQGRPLRVSVNVSPRNLVDVGLVRHVAECVARHGLPTRLLQLEITETVLMSETDAAVDTLHALHAMGIGLAIDDFGTGYSSLSYLKRMPVEELKIDRSFVSDITNNVADSSIVRSTIALAKNLGLRVVAEGVESDDALRQLQALECDVAQGFLIAKPLTVDELDEWLRTREIAPEPAGEDATAGVDVVTPPPVFRWRSAGRSDPSPA